MIGSSSITHSKFQKSPKKEGYLFQKLSCSTELEIRTLYVSPKFANSLSGSALLSSFLRAFALTAFAFAFAFANRDALLWIFFKDSISFNW